MAGISADSSFLASLQRMLMCWDSFLFLLIRTNAASRQFNVVLRVLPALCFVGVSRCLLSRFSVKLCRHVPGGVGIRDQVYGKQD